MKDNPTADQVRGRLSYDKDSGKITRGGVVAGRVNNDGYIQIGVFGKRYQGHRLAWLMYYGEWPNGIVDHINGLREDNRICNLRIATHAQNNQNSTKPFKNNSCGRRGVVWRDKYNRWEAYIYLNNKQISLGLFNSPDAASAAYFQAKCNYHPEWRANRMEVCHNG